MPVYPLDGGQIAREIMVSQDRVGGLRNSLWLSVFAGGLIAFLAVFFPKLTFMGIMFAVFAFQSWQMIQNMDGKGFGGSSW